MRNIAIRSLALVCFLAAASMGVSVAAPGAPVCTAIATDAPLLPIDGGTPVCEQAPAAVEAETTSLACGNSEDWASSLSADGRGKPPKTSCCDPALEPGTGGNPFCFEGHTCCSDGAWRCNNPDGSPSCSAGTVCDGSCGDRGDSCSSDGDCCSNNCRKNGRCA